MQHSIFVFLVLLWSLLVSPLSSQEVLELYDGPIPNSLPSVNREYSVSHELVDSLTYQVSIPELEVFHADQKSGLKPAVIICPGGGYQVLLTKREGSDVARELTKHGVTGVVLKYRLPDSAILIDPSIGPLQDLQTAIRMVRNNAEKWGIDPQQIGVMGFSAGGHLAASSGVHHRNFWVDSTRHENVRPDFMILINPVISFTDDFGHTGSRANLLGERVTEEQVRFFSNEMHVDDDTPPTFLVHNNTDSVVIVENSLAFFEQLRAHHIPAEIHIYEKGEHGFLTWPTREEWFGRVINWIEGRGYGK